MPINAISFQPGINREVTNYSGKGGFYDCNKIRFRAGHAEKIGGWINAYYPNTFYGVARQLWNWETSVSQNLIAFGTNQKYYVNFGSTYYDITPIAGTATLTNPFYTTSGSPLVSVVDSTAVTLGTWITFSGATAVGGLTISGSYEVIGTITSPGIGYTIIASSAATSTAGPGGGTVTTTYQINAGNATVTNNGSGWGGPAWGQGGWGGVTSGGSLITTYLPLRLWSQANFGDNLVMAISDGAMYYWTPAYSGSGFSPAVTINTAATQYVKTTQTVVSAVTSSSTFVVANSQGVDYGAVISLGTGASGGSSIPAGTYVSASPTYTGYTTITVNNASGGAGSVTLAAGDPVNFSYSGKTAPTTVNQVIVSTTNQFAIALGATPYNPATFTQVFSPMLVRWSDQAIPYEWTPATYNQSGEQVLSSGSYIVGGLSTRQENLIWTDRALYSMQYVGAPFVFSFQLMMDNISIASPYAMISVNGATFWMGTDKFYTYNGTVTQLPCSVRKYIFSNINQSQSYQITCGQNEQFNEIWWFYPSLFGGSQSSNTGYVNDSYVVYNYAENTWYYGTLNRTAWYNSSLQSYPLAVFSIQTSYLSAAITTTAAITSIQIINAYSYPETGTVVINNEQFTYTSNTGTALNGVTRAANGTTAATHTIYTKVSFLSPNQILFHEFGVNDGSIDPTNPLPISSYIQTSDFDIANGDHFAYVWRMLPDFTFAGSTATTPQIYLTLNPRNNSGLPYMTGGDIGNVSDSTVSNTVPAPVPPNTYPIEQYTGAIYTRIRGRQMSFNVNSSALNVQWQMGTMRIDMRPDGRR